MKTLTQLITENAYFAEHATVLGYIKENVLDKWSLFAEDDEIPVPNSVSLAMLYTGINVIEPITTAFDALDRLDLDRTTCKSLEGISLAEDSLIVAIALSSDLGEQVSLD